MSWRVALLAAWIVGLAGLTDHRCAVWQSERALWTNAVQRAPFKPRPHINLGRAKEILGDFDGAEQAYRTAISLSFDEGVRDPKAQWFARAAAETNIAHVYLQRGWHASAMRILDQVLTEWPNFPYAQINRAAIFSTVGACGLAQEAYVIAAKYPIALPAPPACVEAP